MRVGSLWGIDVHVNLLFLLLLGLYFVAGVLEKGLLIFALVLWHELAHTMAARLLAVRVIDVEILPFGGVARLGGEMSVQPGKEIAVALAGPAANLFLVGLAMGLKNYGFWSAELGPFFIQTNLMLAFFNLLPALPLDGGRILRALLSLQVGLAEATLLAARLGQVIAVGVACLGVVGVLHRTVGLDVVVIALFVLYAATKEKNLAPYLFVRHLAYKKEELVQAGVLPAEQLVARADVPVKEIVRLFVPQKFFIILLLDRQLATLGQVNEVQVVDALFNYGLEYPVGSLLKPKI
ncbi:M50 family metallopeptidase [Desulforamulus hydrothermalis]|uniref:Peptidase M50 n=1 Tax=Desulforamulus hydrothermalis Lam5 = DSM 18033 TaxID=1121428 RepID=K8EG80_9FIRM|nr:M50 family metallopeptidase [Desulforamulus hydrothermalis]CCO07686.1 Peptidase M50 [Desulforamulus hydrothermalis Lam5 = DSM 18033]SHH25334.1 stage IV sporulation protein FB [Desulforamulus hydrothermalis Lam5 = DSM 18033]